MGVTHKVRDWAKRKQRRLKKMRSPGNPRGIGPQIAKLGQDRFEEFRVPSGVTSRTRDSNRDNPNLPFQAEFVAEFRFAQPALERHFAFLLAPQVLLSSDRRFRMPAIFSAGSSRASSAFIDRLMR